MYVYLLMKFSCYNYNNKNYDSVDNEKIEKICSQFVWRGHILLTMCKWLMHNEVMFTL